ncbi:bola-like protein [Neurospora crassa]|uniref:BolA domain-containing protein n=1 Tax=Neurospora crassa (strain ATCC 24698 / 74-OR23-1A / CBS 708.71 / DSM 1257 / FGSC 987) TaxID=367110 RepID=Q7SDM5_NEUCR|nr:BolA domain-containing protein [Neurospora crassa OR74A]EAA34866.2 BolA domain-containing protein [Neurospora crassa OR74A]KHE80247.1 bola-like protein [Neurospora crassa]|eukprot:XP_964102.2 BolA domain-containing protein [Neurospora crassa OR74A]
MLRRTVFGLARSAIPTRNSATSLSGVFRPLSTTTSIMASSSTVTSESPSSTTPMEDAIREKITTHLAPRTLQIHNDSHLHAHHSAMRGVTSRETHFRVVISSDAFKRKMQPARHRLVYGLLKDEMAKEGGIHALQLRTMTLEEEDKRRDKEEAEERARTCKD